MKYNAFISYSHAADNQLAPKLQRALQQFAKPFYKLKALNIFRDQTSLSSTPELWPTIQKALHESAHFILLASKEAAQSVWVQKEVQEWLNIHQGSVKQMLIVLTNDTIVWDPVANDFDWSVTDAIPLVLKGKFANEPLFVDLRWVKTSSDVSIKSPVFADAVATMAAPLHGVAKEEIYGEEHKQHRKFRQAAAFIILLLLILSSISLYEYFEASAQKKEAQNQLATNFWVGSKEASGRNRVLERLHLMGQAISYSNDEKLTQQWLSDAQPFLPEYALKTRFGKATGGAVFNRSASRVLSWQKEGGLHIHECSTGKEIIALKHQGKIYGAVFSRDERKIVSWGQKEMNVWNANTGARIAGPYVYKTAVDSSLFYGAMFSPDEGHVLSWSLDEVRILELATGKQSVLVGGWSRLEGLLLQQQGETKGYPHDKYIRGALFTKDGSRMLYWNSREVKIWDVAAAKVLTTVRSAEITGAVFNQSETKVLIWGPAQGAGIWDVESGKKISASFTDQDKFTKVRELLGLGRSINAAFSHKELFVLTSGTDGITVWQISDGHKLIGPLVYNDEAGTRVSPAYGAQYTRDDKHILAWGPDGIRVLEVFEGKKVSGPLKHKAEIEGACFSKDESKILSWSRGEARLWDRKTGVAMTVMQHEDHIGGVAWSSNEKYILSWGTDGVRIWEQTKHTKWSSQLVYGNIKVSLLPSAQDSTSGIEADVDFPKDLFLLQVQVTTGTSFDLTTQTAFALSKEKWEEAKKEYLKRGEEHYSSCQYPKSNYWYRYSK